MIDAYINRKWFYEENKGKTYSVVFGQCSDVMWAKLEVTKEFKNVASCSETFDSGGLNHF